MSSQYLATPWGFVDRPSSGLTDEEMTVAIQAALAEYHQTRRDSFDACLKRMVQKAQKAVSNGVQRQNMV